MAIGLAFALAFGLAFGRAFARVTNLFRNFLNGSIQVCRWISEGILMTFENEGSQNPHDFFNRMLIGACQCDLPTCNVINAHVTQDRIPCNRNANEREQCH